MIRKLRENLGLTLRVEEAFAQKLEVTMSTVYRWESGRCHPSRLALKAIERLLADVCMSRKPNQRGEKSWVKG